MESYPVSNFSAMALRIQDACEHHGRVSHAYRVDLLAVDLIEDGADLATITDGEILGLLDRYLA